MKQTLSLIFYIGLSLKLIAQNNCDHNVITNWSGPTNGALPLTPESPTVPDSKYLNAFDWTSTSPIQLSNMQYDQQMVALKNPQQAQYYGYIYDGEELSPKNGWELLLFNVGTYPDLTSNPFGEIPDVPYIVLYNRYSGIVRVFANYGEGYLPTGISFDAVKIILTFNNPLKVNGILRLNEGNDAPLDQKTNILQVVGLAKHPNAPGKWFSADFQLTYDPCICYFPSAMRINFEFITSESLELHGRSISIEQDLINGTALSTKDYLSNFDYTGNTAEGGMIMYKAIENLVDDYEMKLEKYKSELALVNEHNKKVERNLAVVKLFKHTVLQGGNAIISEIAGKVWFNDVINYANDLVGDTVVTKEQIIKEAKKGFASGLDLLIEKNFKKKPTPTSPSTPAATFSEMHFLGALSNSTPIYGPNFYTPGTYGSDGTGAPLVSSALEYPIYNNAVGVFALLNTPKIEISKTVQHDSLLYYTEYDWYGNYMFDGTYRTWTKNYQIKLKEDLKFAFNTALDIKNVAITLGFDIIAKRVYTVNNQSNFNFNINAFNDPHFSTNIESTSIDEKEYSPIKSNTVYSNEIPTEALSNYVDKDTIRFSSIFLPKDGFYPMVFGIGLKNELISQNISVLNPLNEGYDYDFEIKLKVIIDIEYNTLRSDGTSNSMTQIHTFPISAADISWLNTDIIANLTSSTLNIGQYKENLNFSNLDFNGQGVDGCQLNGTEYTCQAWNNIVVAGNISTSNGYTAKLKAGNEIYVINESIVTPETELSINPILNYSHPMPLIDGSYVEQFCKGTLGGNASTYHANLPNKSLAPLTSEENVENSNVNYNSNWDFTMYPNPTKSSTKVVISNYEIEVYDVKVTDMTGKIIEIQKNSPNNYSMDLDFTNSAKGFYFVTILTKDGAKTKQLIVQ